jgi:ankyrin repeat protein
MYGTANDDQSVEVATLLLARGAELDPVDRYGVTPLYHAVEANKIKLARLLLEHGANPGVTSKGSRLSPLLIAVRGRHWEMVSLLLDFKAPTDINDPDGNMSLLTWAIQMRNRELAQLLIEHGATISPPRTVPPSASNSRNQDQYQQWSVTTYNQKNVPWLAAVRAGDTHMLELLLRSNAPVDAVDENGDTALHLAVQNGNTNIVGVLLAANARIDIVNYGGATPMFLAEAAENEGMIEMFQQAALARGMTMESLPAPSREAMRAIARQVCSGDLAALDQLADAAEGMHRGAWKEQARMRLNGDRMHAAFQVMGEEAGKGNTNAIRALKSCLEGNRFLKSYAPDALGIAAAAGNDELLSLLLRFRDWNIPESQAASALAAPAMANKEPAVDFFVTLALDPQGPEHNYNGVGWLVKNVLQKSATNGNPKAKDVLEKFLAASNHKPAN